MGDAQSGWSEQTGDGRECMGMDAGLPAEEPVEQTNNNRGDHGSGGRLRDREIRPEPAAMGSQGGVDGSEDSGGLGFGEAVEEEVSDDGVEACIRESDVEEIGATPFDPIKGADI